MLKLLTHNKLFILAFFVPLMVLEFGHIVLPHIVSDYHFIRLPLPGMAFFLILSPILEETVFRGLLQSVASYLLTRRVIIYLVVNFLFTAFHYNVRRDMLYLIIVFICGNVFSAIRDRYNLLYAVHFHIYYNLLFVLYFS